MNPTTLITADAPSIKEFVNPLLVMRSLVASRELIGRFAWLEVNSRYRGTYLGLAWSIFNPFLTLVVYTLVFGVILRVSFGSVSGSSAHADYAVNFFCGLLIFNFFAGPVGRSAGLMVSNVNYVKRVVFPLEVLPVSAVYANLVDVASGLVILLAALILFQSGLSPSALYFPILLIPLAFLTLGFSWFISAIGVFLRDVGQAVAVLLQLVFFMTPVIYPLSAAPESLRTVLRLNPLTIIVENARRVLIEGHPPEWTWLIVVTIASLAVFQLGYLWFMMSKRAFADVI